MISRSAAAARSQAGRYHASEALVGVEEHLTLAEYNAAVAFLDWLIHNNLKFGHGNIRERFEQFRTGIEVKS